MIINLIDTTTSEVSNQLIKLRDEGGVLALSRVLTLVISCRLGKEGEAIEAANEASQEHPMRVIVLAADNDNRSSSPSLDAEIRVGSDAGASEVIILKAYGEVGDDEETLITGLLLPDVPVVAWWPDRNPASTQETTIGRIAQRRITDASHHQHPRAALKRLADSYRPGDTDLTWTRLTNWRTQLAALLDQPPYLPVLSAEVVAASDSPSCTLMAAWLGTQLEVPVNLILEHVLAGAGNLGGLIRVTLHREDGPITISRPLGESQALLQQPGQPDHVIPLPRRSLRVCLAEELRRLDSDDMFGKVLANPTVWEDPA